MTPTKQNSREEAPEGATSFLYLKARLKDKARWTKAAQKRDMKLADWVTETLNAASLSVPPDQ